MASHRVVSRRLAQLRPCSVLQTAHACSRLSTTSCPQLRQQQMSSTCRALPNTNVVSGLTGINYRHARSLQLPQRRHSTDSGSKSKVYNFDDIKALVENPKEDTILIDVREANEYSAGYIPTAENMPIKTQPDALFLTEDEFEDRFGFPKPDKVDEEVVFYCRSGVRSSAAAKLAEQNGYERIAEYRGSWLDWVEKGGKEKKP